MKANNQLSKILKQIELQQKQLTQNMKNVAKAKVVSKLPKSLPTSLPVNTLNKSSMIFKLFINLAKTILKL